MAKKKQRRAPKAPAVTLTSKGVAQRGADLRALADQIDRYVQTMDALGISELRVLQGNWVKAMQTIRNFIAQQVAGKLLIEAATRGIEAHKVFELPKSR